MTKSMLVAARFGNAPKIHNVAAPGGACTRISFEPQPVPSGLYSPAGQTILVGKDIASAS